MSKLLFIHIPKNAGMSMREVFGMPDVRGMLATHSTIATWRDLLGKAEFSTYRTIAIVRHPCDRLLSAWSFLKQQGPAHQYYWLDAGERCALARYSNVHDAVKDMMEGIRHLPHFAPQTAWLEFPADIMLRFENIKAHWPRLRDEHGLPHLPPHVNQSEHGHWTSVLDCDTIERIKRIYAEDMKLGGWE